MFIADVCCSSSLLNEDQTDARIKLLVFVVYCLFPVVLWRSVGVLSLFIIEKGIFPILSFRLDEFPPTRDLCPIIRQLAA